MEGKTQFCIVGDSAYSISEHTMKPFSEREIREEEDATVQKRKVIFNIKLCGACTVDGTDIVSKIELKKKPLLNRPSITPRMISKKFYVPTTLPSIPSRTWFRSRRWWG